jgi:EAL domain-containing protein (putative c-di-GMP-specific phosphodiesterase class I)/ActR/RegA family two-component response regulator
VQMNAVAQESRALPRYNSVLIVDDSQVQRAHAVRLCRGLGVETVLEASNGLEALALLERSEFELLIVDLEMPTMDGPQLLSQLHSKSIDIPILLASARDAAIVHSVQHLGKVLGLNVLGTLRKPLDEDQIRTALGAAEPLVRSAPAAGPSLFMDEDLLRDAIEGGRLTVHYQPQIELSTGSVRSVEALVRWPHPQLGFIPPDRFIPLAESRGLIHSLTLRVLNETMLNLAQWRGEGLELSVAINLSPQLLRHANLVDEIYALTQAYEISPQHLVFEITETSLFDKASALEVLARLRLRGYRLSLDDYGTGYSSMQQLAQIPFTELKIDRCFVNDVASRDNLQIMLRSAIAMARELGLATVAEGVESAQDLNFVRECGCTFAQGWLISKALSAERLLEWLKAHDSKSFAS